MTQQLKRWESPRRKGRNDKGRGGAARKRQLAKRNQTLRKRLKAQNPAQDSKTHDNERGEPAFSSFLLCP